VFPAKSDSYLTEMLIRNEYYFDLLLPWKTDLIPGLQLFQSKLGWILGGRCHTDSETAGEPTYPTLLASTVGIPPMGVKPSTHMFTTIDSSLLTKPNPDRFWSLVSLGIAESSSTSDDEQAIVQTVQFIEGRYMVTEFLIYLRTTLVIRNQHSRS